MEYVNERFVFCFGKLFFSSSQITITSISLLNPTQSDVRITSVQTDETILNGIKSTSVGTDILPSLAFTSGVVIELNSRSATIKSPINVILAIYGCATPITLRTKGKLEPSKISN